MSDRRRVNGPEASYHPVYEPISAQNAPSASRKRTLGRQQQDIRPIFLQTGLINQANGSAYIETGRTKIVCAVYGPRQNKNSPYSEKGKLNVEVKFTSFASKKRRAPMRDVEDRPTSMQIAQSLLPSLRLELFPKSTIDVFITILEADGDEGCIAAGSVAASAALADAGVEMFGLVAACSASVFDYPGASEGADATMKDDREEDSKGVWLDPDADESASAKGTLVMACMPALGGLTNMRQTGAMSTQQLGDCLQQCLERCADIHHVMSNALLASAKARASS